MKNKIRIFIIILMLVVTTISGVAILNSEREKRLAKYLAEKEFYDSQFNNWMTYKLSYEEQLKKITEENRLTMAATKEQYEKLLLQQPDLVKQHTKTVAETTQQPTQSSNTNVGTVTNAKTTTTQTIKVAKPASKPKTSGS